MKRVIADRNQAMKGVPVALAPLKEHAGDIFAPVTHRDRPFAITALSKGLRFAEKITPQEIPSQRPANSIRRS